MALASLMRLLRLSVSRARIERTDHSKVPRSAQVRMLDLEIADGVHVFQEFGFTSRPIEGAEAVVVCAGGDRSHPIVVATLDRRHPGPSLEPGEVAIFAANGSTILLRAGGGIEITGDITITGAVQIDGDLEVSGDVSDGAGSLADLRLAYNTHTHSETGSTTAPPVPQVPA